MWQCVADYKSDQQKHLEINNSIWQALGPCPSLGVILIPVSSCPVWEIDQPVDTKMDPKILPGWISVFI